MAARVAKWLDYEFEVCDPAGNWNEVPGLYVFAGVESGPQGTRRWRALYVGQTQDFSDRLPNHGDWSEAQDLGATHIHARVEESEAKRDQIECEIWKAFQPPLNEIAPPGCRRHLARLKKARAARASRP